MASFTSICRATARMAVPAFLFSLLFACASPPMHNAIYKKDMAALDRLVQGGHDIHEKGEGSYTPLHLAAREGNTEAVRYLLENGADPSAIDGYDSSALHKAAWKGHPEIARLLIKAGADLNFQGYGSNDSALHTAAFNNTGGVVRVLIEAGCILDLRNDSGQTPLHISAKKGAVETIRMLVDAGADTAARDNAGLTPYNIARNHNMQAAATELAEAGRKASEQRKTWAREEEAHRAFLSARGKGTIEALKHYLSQYPASGDRGASLVLMIDIAYSMPGTREQLLALTAEYPDAIIHIPAEERLYYAGAPELPVFRIVEFIEQDIGQSIILTKIDSNKSGYMNFSLQEIVKLKEMGLSEPIINQMLAVTARTTRDTENRELLAEIEALKNTIETLKRNQGTQVRTMAAPVPASQPQGGGIADAVVNCAAQLAALEACRHAPGGTIGQSICRAAAKSQFPCND